MFAQGSGTNQGEGWDCIWTIARPGGGLYGYWGCLTRDIARVPCNARPKGRDVAAVPPQTGSATFVSSNMQFDKTSRAPAQGLGSIGAVPELLIAGVIADSCNKRAD